MADADDPWANHVRGTPLAEGADPLTNGSWKATTPGKVDGREGQAKRSETIAEGESSAVTGFDGKEAATHDIDTPSEAPLANGTVGDSSKGGLLHASETDGEAGPTHHVDEAEEEEEEAEEEFVYPGAGAQPEQEQQARSGAQVGEPITATATSPTATPQATAAALADEASETETAGPVSEPQPIDYARLGQLCSQGSLEALQSFFSVTTSKPPVGSGVSPFALANEPNPANGLVPIQYAAREGRVDVLKWLIRDVGALVEMEDREGETALHKAAMAGKLPALSFLIASGASANCVDGDGWTPLHNASSKGYLDIVKVLIENAGALTDVKGGRGAWTPLMNAASNGHLPVVRYLTAKQHVDPFQRNAAGETAYDVAAANFEIFICEILEKYESERWAALKFAAPNHEDETSQADRQRRIIAGQGPYNPLALHTTVPIILHENQRLDTRLSTLAIRAGKPRWSGTQAGRPGKPDRRAPGTMPPGPLSLSRTRNLPMARDDVQLPTRAQPYKVRLPNRSAQMAAARSARGEVVNEDDYGSTPTPDSVLRQDRSTAHGEQRSSGNDGEPSHFWLSDWQNDFTHPQVDVEQGWQYSQSFDTPDERWLASIPAPLSRLLEGRGLGASVQRAVSSMVLAASTGAAPVSEAEAISTGWVRRRRWVRVMRRRLDIEFGDDLEAVEQASLGVTSSRAGQTDNTTGIVSPAMTEAQAAARSAAQKLGPDADYLAQSKAMAGSDVGATPADMSGEEVEKRIARIELAVVELRQHAFSDANRERQQNAEGLLKEFTLQLSQLRQVAGLDEESEDEDSDEEFIYPNSYKDGGQSVITRIGGPLATSSGVVPSRPSVTQRQSSTPSIFGERAAPSEAGTSLGAIRSADLANARDFRVPTHEVPQRPLPISGAPAMREQNMLPVWESDHEVTTCRGCNRKFTFFLRKHHCRRCGRIFCDSCSTLRAQLSPDELVIDPGVPEMVMLESHGPSRICDACDAERRLPASLRGARGSESISNAIHGLDIHGASNDAMSDVSSRASELTDCPVCGRALAAFGDDSGLQEEHVRSCLENGGGGSVQGGRYLVYKLAEGPIVGKECQICLEDLLVGMTIARLPCLCYYHRHCIDSWFSRGRSCPVHARTW